MSEQPENAERPTTPSRPRTLSAEPLRRSARRGAAAENGESAEQPCGEVETDELASEPEIASPSADASEPDQASEPVVKPSVEPSDSDIVLARNALFEITSADTIGGPIGAVDEGEGTISIFFAADMVGYPGWRWTVSIAHVDGGSTVLETELMPGDDALLAPEWIPWLDRMTDYRAAQDAAAALGRRLIRRR